ncbi:MAG: hypothetical protein M1821_000238 [Bathelium mastoideum]|nr:MAG: hypothetical protein M1821_000238 [Bathelium mastoideum]
MANFYYPTPHHMNSHSPNSSSHHHHGGRRRAPRPGTAHSHLHKQYNRARNPKEAPPVEVPTISAFVKEFEAARSFDLEDDELFCPFNLLTEDDLQSIHSGSSDRSSLSSGSPESSPLQPQVQPTPNLVLSSATNSFTPSPNFQHSQPQHQQPTKLHQPMAQRVRNAIPIVDPNTRSNVSPPPSVSPARQIQHQYARRW